MFNFHVSFNAFLGILTSQWAWFYVKWTKSAAPSLGLRGGLCWETEGLWTYICPIEPKSGLWSLSSFFFCKFNLFHKVLFKAWIKSKAPKARSWLQRPDLGSKGQILAPKARSWFQRPDQSSKGQILAPKARSWLQRPDLGCKGQIRVPKVSLAIYS